MFLRMGKDWWQKKRKKIIDTLIFCTIWFGSVAAGNLAWQKYGVLTLAQNLYLQSGTMSFLLCASILTTPRRRKYYVSIGAFLIVFLLIDIAIRLFFSAFEIRPGIYWDLLNWTETALILTVKIIFSLVLLAVYWFRPKLKRFLYLICLILLSAVAFFISCIHVRRMLHESLHSHKMHRVDGAGIRAYACSDDTTYLLVPSCVDSDVAQARLIKKDKVTLHFPYWDNSMMLLGYYCNVAQNDFRFVLDTTPKDEKTTLLYLFQYLGDLPAYTKHVECESHMIPAFSRNCLSPDGTRVALNNGEIMDFFDTDSVFTAFAELHEPGYHFIEWTNTPEEWILYYLKEGNQAILLDPISNETVAVHPLSFGSPNPYSLTLSPSKQWLLYAGEYTDYFFWETVGGDDFRYGRISENDAYKDQTYPFWIDDTNFIYQTRSLGLCKINIESKVYADISQPFSLVFWCDYNPDTGHIVWTTITPRKTTTIHACQVGDKSLL